MSTQQHRQAAQAQTPQVSCAIITVSDTRTEQTDVSGQVLHELLARENQKVTRYLILKDEPAHILAALREIAEVGGSDVVLLNGGTGISRRDSTAEAVAEVLEKKLEGFGELFRMLSYPEIGPAAMLSRAVAGTYRGLLVFSMPGSPHAVRLAMEKLILPELAHFVWELRR
jgi:molybdenum cofactor biosynthesis protein B